MNIRHYFRRLKHSIFWQHHWDDAGADRRTCATCDRVEVWKDDGWGWLYEMELAGDDAKHEYDRLFLATSGAGDVSDQGAPAPIESSASPDLSQRTG